MFQYAEKLHHFTAKASGGDTGVRRVRLLQLLYLALDVSECDRDPVLQPILQYCGFRLRAALQVVVHANSLASLAAAARVGP
jgi:hypothetical protein